MDQLASLRFDMWTDGGKSDTALGDRCAFHVEASEGAPGLNRMWFVLTRAELEEIIAGKRSSAVDGYHKLEIFGDRWMFYDMDLPAGDAGVMHVPFRRVEMPRLFVKALFRMARRVWALQRKYMDPDYSHRTPRVEWIIPREHRAHVCRLYGQGKGAVTWDLPGEKTAAILGHVRAAGGESLARGLETVERIARNSTRGFHETAVVRLFASDPSGFDWYAYSPGGRRIMHGGLINHGARMGGHDWSIHT